MTNYTLQSVKVKCVGCGKTRDAMPSEFGPADVPMCDCGMPMATMSVKVEREPKRKAKGAKR